MYALNTFVFLWVYMYQKIKLIYFIFQSKDKNHFLNLNVPYNFLLFFITYIQNEINKFQLFGTHRPIKT